MEKHDLHHEFPEFDAKISELKVSNNHFRKLLDKYEALNHKIHGLETTEVFTDEALKEMRAERLSLKDELYKMLNN